MPFTNEQLERYSRHIILKEIGVKGQKKLMKGSVLIIGAGGLGAPAALYLAAAGVGKIGIVDADVVDLSNLQRQVIHTTADVGKPKVESMDRIKYNIFRSKIQSLRVNINQEKRCLMVHRLRIADTHWDKAVSKAAPKIPCFQ